MHVVRFALLLAPLAACNGDEPGTPPGTSPTDTATVPTVPTIDVGALSERGPYGAGTRSLDITGATGTELTLQLWYPSAVADTELLYDGLIPGRAALDAEVDCDHVRGLIAFSHGYGGTRLQSVFLTEHLASHGWVVVAPDHTGNTVFDLDTVPFEEVLLRRPVDLADAVDAAVGEFVCLDPAAGYVAIGHSFGGYTALAAAGAAVVDLSGQPQDLGDPRVRGAVGLAPWDAAGALADTSPIAVPTLILTGERDETTPLFQVQPLYDALTVELRWFGVLPDGGHYTFSPIACTLEDGDGCGADFVPTDVAEPIVNGAVTAFVEGVRGTPGAFDEVTVDAPEIGWTTP